MAIAGREGWAGPGEGVAGAGLWKSALLMAWCLTAPCVGPSCVCRAAGCTPGRHRSQPEHPSPDVHKVLQVSPRVPWRRVCIHCLFLPGLQLQSA